MIFIITQTPHVQIVHGSIRSKPIHLTQDGRDITVEAREVQLRISFPSGKTGQADLLMLYEPRNKLLWWTYENREGVEPGGITARFFSPVYPNNSEIGNVRLLSAWKNLPEKETLDERESAVLTTPKLGRRKAPKSRSQELTDKRDPKSQSRARP
jgi:hypothetical protein